MADTEVGELKEWRYYDVANYLLSQQFFKPPNFIIDRRDSKKIKVKGSGEVIEKLIRIIQENIKPFEDGKDEEFIALIAKKFDIRTKEIYDKYQNKINNLEDVQREDKKFNLMMTLSVLIEYFQKRSTEYIHKLLKDDLKDDYVNNNLKKSIDMLHQRADDDFLLLLNLGVLLKYSKVTKTEISEKPFEKVLKVVSKKLLKMDK